MSSMEVSWLLIARQSNRVMIVSISKAEVH